MSVLVKGMEMPKDCYECACYDGSGFYCKAMGKVIKNEDPEVVQEWCPLVEVHTPHGNLVDLDAMIDKFWDGDFMEIHSRDLDYIPVIVEAEADHD